MVEIGFWLMPHFSPSAPPRAPARTEARPYQQSSHSLGVLPSEEKTAIYLLWKSYENTDKLKTYIVVS
jgi:hypothetical protein